MELMSWNDPLCDTISDKKVCHAFTRLRRVRSFESGSQLEKFHCCSADTYADFLVTVQWERPPVDGANTTHVIPVTCCKLPGKWPDYGEPSDMNCTLTPTSENSYIDHPCWKELNWYLWYYGLLMAGCCVGSLALEGVGIAVAVWASMDLRSRQLKIMIEKRGFVDPNVPDPNARDDDEFGDDSYVNQGQL
ncbi:hypothetical protein MAR_019924 [Mya arenaria]|uniref:Uncharacterized protein n=1 Tax=Mya arenaria TaxID=6604 RepID=A0ABY7E6J2_MYAAR|nr:hypothetical protein MAR_019924 [Mya arenaria]